MQDMRSIARPTTAYTLIALLLGGCLSAEDDSGARVFEEPTVNAAPTISGAPSSKIAIGNTYSFQPAANDSDGDALVFSINKRPTWATFEPTSGLLSGVPAFMHLGTFNNIEISVSDGTNKVDLQSFSIEVEDLNNGNNNTAPVISGTPGTTVAVDATYMFQPTASDADGDLLTFGIQNQPSWATFDTSNGQLTGAPQAGDENTYANILITVSDNDVTSSLPNFSITVEESDPGNNNTAPVISGTPGTTVAVDATYTFQPTASDADGDLLTFAIQNQPSWATFDTSNGQLTGTPQAGDENTYANILITVSDNDVTSSLPSFSITVVQQASGSATLSWVAPTTNDDGSALTNLSGFRIYYGTATATYTETVQIDNPGMLTHVVENLSPDTYYFATTAFTTTGVESSFSNEASKVIN